MTRPFTITKALEAWLVAGNHTMPVMPDADEETRWNHYGRTTTQMLAEGTLSPDKFDSLLGNEVNTMNSPDPQKVYGGGQRIRVKDQSEKYSSEKSYGRHVKTGLEVINPLTNDMAQYPSEVENAKCGALLKHLGQRSGLFPSVALDEHEKSLLGELANDPWAGSIGGEVYDSIKDPQRIKALIDDSSSGGLEITPIAFDDNIITFPLLTGELLPHVDLRPIDRGRRIEGASVGNPTITWGQGDDTTVGLFSTASLVAALDSTVFGAAVAVEVGRDFLSDAAVNVGNILTTNIGQRLQEELDNVIANGNGSTQPEGILTASGLSTVNSDNAASGPPTLNDYITLMFSIGKQYRNKAFNPSFLSNDTTFQRSRAVKVDTASPSTDQRPVISPLTQINTYSTLGWNHAVQNDIGNRSVVFGALKKYRLYRRVGMEIRFVDGGTTLARKNMVLLIARARYAGRVMDANAFAKWTDGQS